MTLNAACIPQDVARLVFTEWLPSADLDLVSKLDVSFGCSRVHRLWYREILKGREVDVSSYYLSHSSRMVSLLRWVISRELKVKTLSVHFKELLLDTLPSSELIMLSNELNALVSKPRVDGNSDPQSFCSFLDIVAVLVTASVQVSFHLESDDHISCIPWRAMVKSTSLQNLSVFCSDSLREDVLLQIPSLGAKFRTLTRLQVEAIQCSWEHFEQLLSICPCLQVLSVNGEFNEPFVKLESFTPVLPQLRKMSIVDCDSAVTSCLLKHCPNITSLSTWNETSLLSEVLVPSAFPQLRHLHCGFPHMHFSLFESTGSMWFELDSEGPFTAVWPGMESSSSSADRLSPAEKLFKDLHDLATTSSSSRATPMKFVLRLDAMPQFFSEYMAQVELHSLPVTHLTAYARKFQDVDELFSIFTLPYLQEISLNCNSDQQHYESESVYRKALQRCRSAILERELVFSPLLVSMSLCDFHMRGYIAELVQLTPHLTTLKLDNCDIDNRGMIAIFASLRHLSCLDVCNDDDDEDVTEPWSEFEFDWYVDVSDRPPRMLSMLVKGPLLIPSWSVLRSLVHGLGSYLKELKVICESSRHELRIERDAEFLAANRHVYVR